MILTGRRILTHPFRHVVARFTGGELLTQVLREFPATDWSGWYPYIHEHTLKKGSRGVLPGPAAQRLVEILEMPSFLGDLASWLEIERPLLPDPTREGGGLHLSEPGGFLDMHVDFNVHPTFGWDRRVNLLLYLNHSWEVRDGGYLELGADRSVAYAPEFARVVAFPTRDDTLHGHPVPVTRSRKSLALYYYTEGRPDHERSRVHSTLYVPA